MRQVFDKDMRLRRYRLERLDEVGEPRGGQRHIAAARDPRVQRHEEGVAVVLETVAREIDQDHRVRRSQPGLGLEGLERPREHFAVDIRHRRHVEADLRERLRDEAGIVDARGQRRQGIVRVADDESEARRVAGLLRTGWRDMPGKGRKQAADERNGRGGTD